MELFTVMIGFTFNDWVNLTSVFGCDVQQERNWEFMMYM